MLKVIGSVEEEFAAPILERENRQRIIPVKSSFGYGLPFGEVVAAVNELPATYHVPGGVGL